MRTPKKWLQDWLGITPLAVRVAEMDIEEAKTGSAGYTAEHFYAIPMEEEQAYITEEIKRGYELK